MFRTMAVPATLAGLLAWGGAVCGADEPRAPDRSPVPGNLNVAWIHGSADCATNQDPPIQVHRYNDDTFILRENKCVSFEAPFLYLVFGEDKALLLDSGATASPRRFPVRDTVQEIVQRWLAQHKKKSIALVVAHTHSHGDHVMGDGQFRGRPDTTLVGLRVADVKAFFHIEDWPTQVVTFDLGNRALKIIPIPGHEASHIAVYDPQTQILLTGDTLYPGRLYIDDWKVYRDSVHRLALFAREHPVTHVLGAHVEMSDQPGKDYPAGCTYQPHEHPLPLKLEHLLELDKAVEAMGDRAKREVHDDFIIYPLR